VLAADAEVGRHNRRCPVSVIAGRVR